ncbi:Protein kinase domain [Trypanosoma melophagium]|uniref:Protein kinase domain n=1 Tax=Trypanosoma melophagium TaxID=715481 RepID=UPI00351A9639|nr:Protein kinase domain [Trypanosoma melophagium]
MDRVVDNTVGGSSNEPTDAEDSINKADRRCHSEWVPMLTSFPSRERQNPASLRSRWEFGITQSFSCMPSSHVETPMMMMTPSTEVISTTNDTNTTTTSGIGIGNSSMSSSGGGVKNNNSWAYTQLCNRSPGSGLPLQNWNIERSPLDNSCRLSAAAQISGDVSRDSVVKRYRTSESRLSEESEVLLPQDPHQTSTFSKKCSIETGTETSDFIIEAKGCPCCMLLTCQRDELPVTPKEALTLCKSHLSAYEQKEILEFHEIYYCGSHAHRPPLTSTTVGEYSGNYIHYRKEQQQQQQQWARQCSPQNFDDEEHNYRVICGDHMAYRYELLDILGRGTYGVVVRALDHAARPTPQQCALKIARNIPSYATALALEADILEYLRRTRQQLGMWIPQVLSRFTFRSHEILVLPLYGLDLKKLLRVNLFRPLPSKLVRAITAQMIATFQALSAVNVTHADVKPDNVVLINRSLYDKAIPHSIEQQLREEMELKRGCAQVSNATPNCEHHRVTSVSDTSSCINHTQGLKNESESNFSSNDNYLDLDVDGSEVKRQNESDNDTVTSQISMIDFGSARVGTSCAHPVQTLNYRAPEAALRLSYGPAIDMWSLGCVVYELIKGLPLFQAESDMELLQSHLAVLGPPSIASQRALENLFVKLNNVEDEKYTAQRELFFASLQTNKGRTNPMPEGTNLLQLLHIKVNKEKTSHHQEKAEEENKKKQEDVDGMPHSDISTVKTATTTIESQGGVEKYSPLIMLDFLLGCLSWDPSERLTPDEACCHPFLSTFFRGGGAGGVVGIGGYDKVPSMTRCSGFYFLRSHTLTRSATDILETVEKELLHQTPEVTFSDKTQISMRLDVRLAIRPLRSFTRDETGGGNNTYSETPLRVSAIWLPVQESVVGGENDIPRSYTATFFDPFEHVQVSIMSFEDY